jgi:hypothetical protein
MALVAIDEIFSAGALSTWTFSIENGQGCYIPAYQRPYSWDKANAARLFEDATNGIEQMLQRSSTISFLGTIIAIHDIKHVTVKPLLKQEVPQKVMTIIDGQQRLCTMMMINIAFHDHIRRLRKPFEGKAEEHFKWIAEDSVLRVADLEKAILLDMNAGEENQRFYPRIIRAMDDQWSRRKAHAAYTSPIARLIWEYILHFKLGQAKQFRYDPLDAAGKRIAAHEPLADTFRYIQREIIQICAGKAEDHVLPDTKVLVDAPNMGEGLWGFTLPECVVRFIKEGEAEAKHAEFCQLFRLALLSRYMDNRMAFTIVTTKSEDDAFDMFEALNTTGEPLTAFETLKPRVIEAETLPDYEHSASYQHVKAIEAYLDKFKKAEEKQTATSELLVPFALAETGDKLQKRLSEQRRYLRDTYESLPDVAGKRDFLQSLANLANFTRTAWSVGADEVPVFEPFEIKDDDVLVCFDALRDLKHNITIAPLVRFYDAAYRTLGEERAKKIEELKQAIRATAAFSMLWRGAKGGTDNIDSHYREVMRTGVSSLSIPPLGKRAAGSQGTISIDEYKKALRYYLQTKGELPDKDSWVKAAARVPVYLHARTVARFLLFCATDNAVMDGAAPGLIKRGRPGTAPLFKLDAWQRESYYTVEHIAPRKQSQHWASKFFDDPDLVHQLGNLILLPQEANSLIADRSWAHKKRFYELLSVDTVEEQETIKADLKSFGVNLSKAGEQIIKTADYNQTCKAIAKVTGDWSVEVIEARSKRIAELAWEKLAAWLDLA